MKKSIADLITDLARDTVKHGQDFYSVIDELRRQLVLEALVVTSSHAACARKLGINRTTLVEMLNKMQIDSSKYLLSE
jgi:DNA-binding NtrC family response regulator